MSALEVIDRHGESEWRRDAHLCWLNNRGADEDWITLADLENHKVACDRPAAHEHGSLLGFGAFDTATQGTASMEARIDASRAILTTRVDPEDELSPTYSTAVWERAVRFLRDIAKLSYQRLGRIFDEPAIEPGPDGSVDLHWDHKSYELLINIPGDPGKAVEFYGDDRARTRFRGTLDPARPQLALVLWLNERR